MSMTYCPECGYYDTDNDVEHEEQHILEIAGNNINLAEITRD